MGKAYGAFGSDTGRLAGCQGEHWGFLNHDRCRMICLAGVQPQLKRCSAIQPDFYEGLVTHLL